MIYKKILAFLLCSIVPVLSLHAGGHNLPYGGPKSALEYYKNGGIVDVFPLAPVSFGWDTFPKELLEIPTLEDLNLPLVDPTIPEEIVKLNKLRKLSIWGSSANLILPKSIAKMKKLKYLSIEGANIENLEQLCTYTQIETLELKSMGLKELPECIGQLMNLKELNLAGNQLSTLPNSIVNLINLENWIELQGNNADEFIFPGVSSLSGSKFFDKNLQSYKESIKVVIPDNPSIPLAYTVIATSGLSVRSKPKLKAKKIGIMPHKLKIAVYEESSKTETIDGITAPWMRIKAVANGQYMEGWAWGGYLKEYKYEEDYQLRFQEMVNESMDRTYNLTLDTKQIQLFIKNGADINTQVNDGEPPGWTLLNIVAEYGNIQDFRFLLANGADFQIKVADVISAASFVMRRKNIGPESKKFFFSALQNYGYNFKSERKELINGAVYSSFKCGVPVEEQSFDSEELDFLKEQLDIKSVSKIFSDEDIQTIYRNIQEYQCPP